MTARAQPNGSKRLGTIPRLFAVAVCALLIAAGKPAPSAKTGSTPTPGAADTVETKSSVVLLIDHGSGSVVFDKNADKPFPPASLTKMMTIAVAARELKEGRLSLDGEFPVSEHAWRTGGAPSRTSAMFAPVHSKVKVSDLFQGIMVQSANDGAIALAEGIAGSETAFAELMNARAAELGMKHTRFGNPTGLPHPDNVTTARDLAVLARHIVNEYPDVYRIYAQREFTYNKIRQLNRNPLLDAGIGADGMKTGFIKEAGYNIVGSAVQGAQRLILVIGGAPSEKDRAEEARRLLDWGFRSFETVHLYDAGQTIGEAAVFGGAARTVKVASDKRVEFLAPRGNRAKLQGRVVYTGPIRAPVAAGQPIGRLLISQADTVVQEIPVQAAESVDVGPITARAVDGARELLLGLFRR
ncbi:MAG: D-alanyl-D-alanine carboxypeptidase family protein [Siculibacillus sp.]